MIKVNVNKAICFVQASGDSTLSAMALLVAGRINMQKALDTLKAYQRGDGSWDEPDEIRRYNPPSWMMPGHYENQLWLTSAVCCKLKELAREQDVDFDQALNFLRQGGTEIGFRCLDIYTGW